MFKHELLVLGASNCTRSALRCNYPNTEAIKQIKKKGRRIDSQSDPVVHHGTTDGRRAERNGERREALSPPLNLSRPENS